MKVGELRALLEQCDEEGLVSVLPVSPPGGVLGVSRAEKVTHGVAIFASELAKQECGPNCIGCKLLERARQMRKSRRPDDE